MDTDKLLKIAQRVHDKAEGNAEFAPALEQLKRLLRALEQGKQSDPSHAFKILSAAIMLDIMADPASNAPYNKDQIDAILGDLGTDEGPAGKIAKPNVATSAAEEDSTTPLPESTNPYLAYMRGNSKLY